jgi:hypothetical protein
MSEKRKVRATITFFGEPRRILKPGDKVELHLPSGSWQGGFRCTSDPLEEDGERVVWVVREEEYQAATREWRDPAGNKWPLDQLAGVS